MKIFVHKLSLIIYSTIVLIAIAGLTYNGLTYYNLPIEERYFSQLDVLLKPSGFIGHGLGIIGTLLIVVGQFGYMARKRLKIFSRIGVLKYWLELHIFLTTLGTVFVLFHTTFKFGGLVSVGFWSLVIVWVSGVVGRYLYLHIPHTIEGRELSLQEVKDLKNELDLELKNKYDIDFSEIKSTKYSQLRLKHISKNISKDDLKKVKQLIRDEKRASKRIEHLSMMQNLFKYWHVAHLPFALIMLIIMVIHVGVSLFFGYKWIF
jgi:hypothetical protein